MKKLALLLCVFFALSQSSCSLLSLTPKTVTIEDVGWYIENTPADRWAVDSANKPSLVYNFEVYFKENLSASDIRYVRVYLPNGSSSYWTINVDTFFNDDTLSVGGNTHCWYSANSRELPIGTLRAEIMLSNGNSDSYTFTMGKPGSTSTDGYAYVYCLDDESSPTYAASSTPAIMRPIVTDFVNDGTQITTTFTAKGDNVRNGWIWYYDSTDAYVGRSRAFYNQTIGQSLSRFSSGSFQNAADSVNILPQDASEITDRNGSTLSSTAFSSIAHCRVYLTDGAQYSGSSAVAYDYGAISSYF